MIKGAAIFAVGSGLGLIAGGVGGLLIGYSVSQRGQLWSLYFNEQRKVPDAPGIPSHVIIQDQEASE